MAEISKLKRIIISAFLVLNLFSVIYSNQPGITQRISQKILRDYSPQILKKKYSFIS